MTMKRTKFRRLVFSCLILGAALACTKRSTEPAVPSGGGETPSDGFSEASAAGVTFKWKINGNNLDCRVSAQTTGWVAVGFNSTASMSGADFIIGYVTGASTVTLRDEHGTGHSHAIDAVEHILNGSSGTESGGVTTIAFSIPLNTGDLQDFVLTKGASVTVLFSYGTTDNPTTQHAAFGTKQIILN
jgi:hypothetical protein